MKLRLPVLRALAPVLFAAAAFAQADYSTPYTVTKYAGLNGVAGSNDGTINFAQLNLPIGVAFDASGNLYVADSGNQTIRKISPTGISSTFAGAAGALGANDGSGSNARFSTPSGVAVDSAGNVYVSDSGNHRGRRSHDLRRLRGKLRLGRRHRLRGALQQSDRSGVHQQRRSARGGFEQPRAA
jgi:hypothetical protein